MSDKTLREALEDFAAKQEACESFGGGGSFDRGYSAGRRAAGAMLRELLAAHTEPAPATPPQPVLDFINARTEYVQAARNQTGDDNEADYWRWQGHMEARSQLAQTLGYTVPFEPGEKTTTAAVKAGQ